MAFKHWLLSRILKTHFPYNAVCTCKHIHQKQIHIRWKNIFHKVTLTTTMCSTLFDILYFLCSFFNNKKMMVVNHYIDFNTNQRKPSNTLKKPHTEDVLTLFLNTESNTLCRCFYFSKNTQNLESFKKIPIISKTTQSSLNKTQSFISLTFISLRKN